MSEQFDIEKYLGMTISPDIESVTMNRDSFMRIKVEFATTRTELGRVEGELDTKDSIIHTLNADIQIKNKQLERLRGELEAMRHVVTSAVSYVERSSGPNVDSWPEFQFLQSAVMQYQKVTQPPPAADMEKKHE